MSLLRAALVLLAGLSAASPSTRAPTLFDGLALGPHAVGFAELRAGEVPVAFWYPAVGAGTRRMLRDYLADDLAAEREALHGAGVPDADVESFVAAPMIALTDAAHERGRFPLVLVAQGNGQSAANQAVLCEFLASFGFVVATTPSPTRTHPMTSEKDIPAIADRQARDLAAAAALLARDPGVDASRLAVIGHSLGARAALLLAMRDPRVRRLVSLDGGIGTATGVAAFRRAPGWNTQVRTRILHFYERLDPFMAPDFSLLASLHRLQVTKQELRGLHHAHFTTLGFGAATIPSIAEATHAGATLPEDERELARRTLAFLRG